MPLDGRSHIRRVLCLSGGGFRGVFSARILSKFEESIGEPAADRFDLVVGTSTGAIIGAALALRIPAKDIEAAYLESGPQIFQPRWIPFDYPGKQFLGNWARLFISSPYSAVRIRKAIRLIVGDENARASLKELNIPLAVIALSHTEGRARLFGSGIFAEDFPNISLEDALVASASAPTYFPSLLLNSESLVDGGLVANAPELVAIWVAISKFGVDLANLRILGIGTASPDNGQAVRRRDNRGILAWLLSKRGLIQLTIGAQERLARDITAGLLGDNYRLIDWAPSAAQGSAFGEMDNTREQAGETLQGLGEIAWNEFVKHERNRSFIGELLK